MLVPLLLALASGACSSDDENPARARAGVAPASVNVFPARVRRLTPSEYAATVAVALGPGDFGAIDFPNDAMANGYRNKSDGLRVTSLLAETLFNNVPAIATKAAPGLVTAGACGDDDGCATKILTDVAARAYRRTPSPEELGDLMTAYHAGHDGADFTAGIETALEVILGASELLYRTELGDDALGTAPRQLTSHEIAEELSYLVTGGPPDAELAASTSLTAADAREAAARRLLALPEARGPLGTFAAEWLEVSDVPSAARDAQTFPAWNDLRGRELTGTKDFFAEAVLTDKADLSALLTAPWTKADDTLAAFYGGTPGDRVTPSHLHAGILTEASVLSAHARTVDSSPIQRGHFVRTRLLCQPIPPPPPTLKISPPPADPTQSTRERFEAHVANASCKGCHTQMDPIGYGFENFDAIGAWRTTDNGKPIDATGKLSGAGSSADGAINGPVELGQRLAQSEAARRCFTNNWLEYATAKPMDEATEAALHDASASFVAGKASVVDLVIAFVRSDAFVWRAPQPH